MEPPAPDRLVTKISQARVTFREFWFKSSVDGESLEDFSQLPRLSLLRIPYASPVVVSCQSYIIMSSSMSEQVPSLDRTMPEDRDDKTGTQTPALSENEKAVNEMFANAALATDKEHNMTLKQGLKLYPKAIAWSALISTLCAMEGYDISLIGNFCESGVSESEIS